MIPNDTRALRQRAVELRLLAARLERTALSDAARAAGPATWRGSNVDGCADDLHSAARRLASCADELRRTAARLESEASVGPP